MNRTILFVTALCLCIVTFFTVYSQKKTDQVSPKDTAEQKEQQDWHENWELFLKAYQDCLNDQSCKFEQFYGQTFTWEGVFKGIRKIEQGEEKGQEVADVEMTSSTMIDRKGREVKVSNDLTLKPSDLEAWRKLIVGEKVRFRTKNLDSAYGAIFMPFGRSGAVDCCFVVLLDGKADLLPISTTPNK